MSSMIQETIPVILESIISAEFVDDEIEAAHEALATGGPRPRAGCAGRRRSNPATKTMGEAVTAGLARL